MFLFLCVCVFGDPVEVKISVMEGDDVSLHPEVTDIQRHDDINWKFNDHLIDHRFKNSELNQQTGDLNIKNIRHDQSGKYEVNITGSKLIFRTFRVYVRGE